MCVFNYFGHLFIGAGTGFLYSKYLHPAYFVFYKHPYFWVGLLIGALILDLDHQSSVINQKILLINKKWFQQLVYVALAALIVVHWHYSPKSLILGALLVLTAFSAHRTFTHSPTGLALICGAIWFCIGVNDLSIGLWVGIASHIVGDRVHDLVLS